MTVGEFLVSPEYLRVMDDRLLGCDGDQKGNLFLMECTGMDKNGLCAERNGASSDRSSIDSMDLLGVR